MEALMDHGWSCAKNPAGFSHTGEVILPTLKKYLETSGSQGPVGKKVCEK
jgi:hypothetical protein